MSVFTPVTADEAGAWLKRYTVGQLTGLVGIAAGIENTNYFLSTTHGEYVLTLFEKLSLTALPYYVNLMAHLAHHGIPCPLPIEKIDGDYLGMLNSKPAVLVSRLPGRPVDEPTVPHCREVGEMLAAMHLAGASYKGQMETWRGLKWWQEFVPRVSPLLPVEEAELAAAELAFQMRQNYSSLPRGVVHADLFRDNILFVGSRIGGLIDFYFACNDALLFDLAVTANDWCVSGAAIVDAGRTQALLQAYQSVRPLTGAEKSAWPAMLRAAALRTWLGRLGYSYFPQPGEMTHTKDHGHFRRLLDGLAAMPIE